jgi:hypothetical protein
VSGRRRGSSGWKDAQAEFGEAQPVIAGMELKAQTRRSHILAGAADDSLRQHQTWAGEDLHAAP